MSTEPSPTLPKSEERIVGPWSPIGRAWEVTRQVPTVVGMFRPIVFESEPLAVQVRIERRPVWEFVGYEERRVES